MGALQDRNKAAVIRNYEEIWNHGKLEIADEIVAPEFTDHPPTRFFDVGLSGPASLKEAVSHFRDAFSDFHDTMEAIVAEGDRVAYLGTISGTHDGDLFGFPATGQKMSVRGVNFFRMEDGIIAERWGQFDVLSMMQQLGIAPSPMGPPPFPDVKAGTVTSSTDDTDVASNKAVYQRMVDEIVNQGKFEVADELFPADYLDHAAPPGLPGGPEGVKAIFGMFRTGFPDVKFTIDDMVGEDDVVATLVHGEGTNTGEFMGMPPTGKHAVWRSVGFFRVRDGQICEHWGIPDLLGLLIQLGVIPPPPALSARPHA